MGPTIGRVVHYKVSKNNSDLMQNGVGEGELLPAIIVRVWPNEYGDQPGLNLRVFCDGQTDGWVTSAKEGTEPGEWQWPQIVK